MNDWPLPKTVNDFGERVWGTANLQEWKLHARGRISRLVWCTLDILESAGLRSCSCTDCFLPGSHTQEWWTASAAWSDPATHWRVSSHFAGFVVESSPDIAQVCPSKWWRVCRSQEGAPSWKTGQYPRGSFANEDCCWWERIWRRILLVDLFDVMLLEY